MSPRTLGKPTLRLAVALTVTLALPFAARGQIAGESVNMVSGTQWPGGDPFLQRQNEPSIAVSSANPQHLLAGANDYRTIDIPIVPDATKMAADAWQGVFKSYDGGQTWKSYLMPGYPQDTSWDGTHSAVRGPGGEVLYNASADPVVRAGTDGMFYFAGIAFKRGTSDGRVVLNRFIDLNNKENGAPSLGTDSIQWIDAKVIDQGGTYFADKPWIAIDIPRAGALTCTIQKADPASTTGKQLFQRSFLGGAIYMVWARIHGDTRADVMFSRSLDCGETWSVPLQLNDATSLASQGVVASVDPRTGDVYVAWRRFAVPATPTSPAQDDAIFAARTFSKGRKFTRPRLLTSITPFDQAQDPARLRFRTEALPTITSSVNPAGTLSWTHVAWAQRGTNGDSQIVVSLVPVKPPPPSNDEDDDPCDGWKIPAVPLDTAPITDDAGNAFTRGHQFMPQLTFSQGRIVAVYYDSRLDHTRNYYKPYDPCLPLGTCWGPDPKGRWYTEERGPLGERGPLDLAWVFGDANELDDTDLTKTRRTIDVRVAMAAPATQPVFTSIALSRMPYGSRGDEANPDPADPSRDLADIIAGVLYFRPFAFGEGKHIDLLGPLTDPFPPPAGAPPALPDLLRLQDLQVNPPNLPMFKNGTVPFIGDYIDIQGPMFVRTAAGWAFNTQPTSSPVFHAVWTSNQDVVAPPDGDWTKFTPPGNRGGLPTLVDSVPANTTVPICDPDPTRPRYAGTRNQNIYTARISDGLFVTSPQNAKSLNTSFPRNFVISAFNATSSDRTFAFSFTPPPGVEAYFQGPGGTRVTSLTVTIPAHSSASQTVFMKLAGGANPATMAVNVTEVVGSLAGSVTLNPPGLTFDLSQPEGTGDLIAAGEVLTVKISAAHLSNANLSNANLSNAHLSNANLSNANLSNANLSNANLSNSTTAAAHLSNANLSNANLSNANLSNANLSNANLSNANLSNANLSNANLSNASVTDIDYTVTNTGNTTQAFDVRLLATAAINPVQLIVSRTYTKPIANGCELVEQPDNKLVVNAGIVDPADPASVGTQNPLATFPLAPGETIQVTLRSFSTIAEARTLATTVAPVVTSQGNPGSTSVALLVQNDAALPAAKVGVAYALPLQAIGGTGTLTWDVAVGSVLPDGLQIVGSQITGSPSAAGSFAFTLQLTDEAAPKNLTQKDVTLVIQKGASTAALTPSGTSPVFGQTVTLTANVSPSSGPTGNVAFFEGATNLGSAPLVSGTAVLDVPASALSVGAHVFTATYPGDGSWEGFSATAPSVDVAPASTSVSLASAGPTIYGRPATFTAQVNVVSPGTGIPSGRVEFREGASVLETVSLSGGTAVFATSALTGGVHTLVAAYLGDGNFVAAQSASVVQSVDKVSASVAVALDPASPVFGATVGIVATVGPVPAGAKNPSGNVYFWDGAILLGSQPLPSTGNSATFLATGLVAGAHTLGASFDSDTNYSGAPRKDVLVVIAKAGVTVDLTSTPSSSTYGEAVSFVAHVTSAAGVPGGTVTFYRDVSTFLGTASLDATGFATLVTSGVPGGTHPVSAYYEGAPNFGANGTGTSVNQLVNTASTTATLASTPNPSRSGELVALSCTVASSGSPTGTVKFKDGGILLLQVTGPTSSTASSATWTYATSALAAGPHSLTCEYVTDGNFAAAISLPLTQTVTSPATTTTLTASPNPVREDKLVTLTATVASTGGIPTGTVTFMDGTKAIGTATLSTLGKATLTRKPGQEGVHSITAVYAGSPSFATSTSAAVALKVLEEYSCSAYKLPLVTGGTVSAPSKSGTFTFGTKVAVKWQFRKATGAYVSRPTAVKSLEAVYDVLCNGKPAATATRIALFDPATGPAAGSTFNYDVAANQYNLGWATTGASRGCWDIVLTPDNGVPKVATILKLQ